MQATCLALYNNTGLLCRETEIVGLGKTKLNTEDVQLKESWILRHATRARVGLRILENKRVCKAQLAHHELCITLLFGTLLQACVTLTLPRVIILFLINERRIRVSP